MNNINAIEAIKEFSDSGVYLVDFKGEQKIFIKNGDSVGAVVFWLGASAEKCIAIICNDVKQEFLKALAQAKEVADAKTP